MRGPDDKQNGMFTYVSADKRVPQEHLLRKIRPLADQAPERDVATAKAYAFRYRSQQLCSRLRANSNAGQA